MECIIITGMSGAGKTTTLKIFEDMGYFCVDNLPISLIPKFIELCDKPNSEIKRVALGIDIRGGKIFQDFFNYISKMGNNTVSFKILFLDCLDKIILKRYKETRRNHPLSMEDRLINGILKERKILADIKKNSDYIIDTSYLLTRELKLKINDIFIKNQNFESIIINIVSFGFKYGVPSDIDLVFDVRFLPNPFYIDDLKLKTGNDKPVNDYVMKFEESKIFLDKLIDMVKFLIPNYIKEGKNRLVIGIGCTGGKHRSVTLANQLFYALESFKHNIFICHRDVDKDINK